MEKHITYITEQCGARWAVTPAGNANRSFWVYLLGGVSQARPNVVGFYAASIEAACDALNN